MPNWISNQLFIRGDKETITNLKNKLDSIKEEKKQITLYDFIGEYPKELDCDTTNSLDSYLHNKESEKKSPLTDEEKAYYTKEYDDTKRAVKEKYGVSGWYDFNIKYLGCKWNMPLEEDIWVETSGDKMILEFNIETPWSAPIEWAKNVESVWSGVDVFGFSNGEDWEYLCGWDSDGKSYDGFSDTIDYLFSLYEKGEYAKMTPILRETDIYIPDNCEDYEEGLLWEYFYDVLETNTLSFKTKIYSCTI